MKRHTFLLTVRGDKVEQREEEDSVVEERESESRGMSLLLASPEWKMDVKHSRTLWSLSSDFIIILQEKEDLSQLKPSMPLSMGPSRRRCWTHAPQRLSIQN